MCGKNGKGFKQGGAAGLWAGPDGTAISEDGDGKRKAHCGARGKNGVQKARSKVRINGKTLPYGKELGRALSKEGESGKRRTYCEVRGKTVFKTDAVK